MIDLMRSAWTPTFAGDAIPADLRELLVDAFAPDGLTYIACAAHDGVVDALGYRDQRDPRMRRWIRAHRAAP